MCKLHSKQKINFYNNIIIKIIYKARVSYHLVECIQLSSSFASTSTG
jgi:hypothetical protein